MSVLIIGAGISGLACAYRLKQLGLDVRLLEQSSRVGGVIDSQNIQGFQFDLGPQSFLSSDLTLRLVSELGLKSEMVQANPRAPRFVLVGRELQPVPMSPPALVKTKLISRATKLRLLTEPLRSSRPPEDDESVAGFARRKFGSDLLDNLLAPFVSGVYAGDPERISFRSAFPSVHQWEDERGSVIRGALRSRPPKGSPRPVLTSFRGGLHTLMLKLADSLGGAIETGVEITGLVATPDLKYEVQTRAGSGSTPRKADAVVLATPAYATARIIAGLSGIAAESLAKIEYAPVAVVNLGYRREQVGHSLDGFGFLVPRGQNIRLLGTIWGSSLFPGRAPDGMLSLTSFLGGATDTALFDLDDAGILQVATSENSRVLRITGEPALQHLQRYSRAIPQYNLGHGKLLGAINSELSRHPGFYLTGNYFRGPAIGTCVETAFATAEEIRKTIA